MNWDAVGADGEILGAVAVVASLICLARLLGQNPMRLQGTPLTHRRPIRASLEPLLSLSQGRFRWPATSSGRRSRAYSGEMVPLRRRRCSRNSWVPKRDAF